MTWLLILVGLAGWVLFWHARSALKGAHDVAAFLLLEYSPEGMHVVTVRDQTAYVRSGYRGIECVLNDDSSLTVSLAEKT